MQATVTTRRFGFGQVGSIVAAAGIAASLALGAAGLALTDNLPAIGNDDALVLPQAYYVPNQGEGRVGGNEAITSAIQGHVADGMGEGWVASGRPAASRPAMDRADYLAWEQNTQLPGESSAGQSAYVMRAQDDIVVPTDEADVALLAPEYRAGTGEINF